MNYPRGRRLAQYNKSENIDELVSITHNSKVIYNPFIDDKGLDIDPIINYGQAFENSIFAKIDNWHYDNTGGRCMVLFKDFKLKDGSIRCIGINGECIVIYKCSYDEYWEIEDDMTMRAWYWSDGIDLSQYLNTEDITEIIDAHKAYLLL